ncbi:MAG: T9SS type A sorting domain-containing protein [Bacteroidales bacterium]|nr:T9SS type A sorting domain-containing protein [Bacteroidales bacterium]
MKKLSYLFSSALLGLFFTLTSFSAQAQAPYITVIQPNGGEQWVVGTTHLISWNDNLTNPVMILLSTDGINFSDTLTHSTAGTTWTWNIPSSQDTSSTCLIRVESTVDNSLSGTSSAFFALKGAQPVDSNAFIQPNGGESWATGTSHLITWVNYVSNSRLKLSTDGGVTYTTIAGADSISGSTYTWNIPTSQTLSDNCRMKLESRSDTNVFIVSDTNFSIVSTPSDGVIDLFQPNDAGIHWKQGTQHLISWSNNFSAKVKVELLRGGTLYSVLSDSTDGSGYAWTIADSVRVDTNYKIVVSNVLNSAIADTSNYSFAVDSVSSSGGSGAADTIVLVQPNGGNQWAVGTEHLISWYDNFTSPVKIELLSADTVYSVLANSVSGNGFGWVIGDTVPVGSDFKIKLTSTADTTVLDTSDSAFSILATPTGGTIDLVQPDGGESWVLGTEHLISWSDNFTNPVTVELFKADSLYSVLATGITNNRYAWTISDTIPVGSDFIVKVFNEADPSIIDTSANYFNIIAIPQNGVIKLAQPNGGETWAMNHDYLISWSDNFSYPVKVDLYHEDTLYTVLNASATGNSFTWNVPDTIPADSNYRVRITSTADTNVWDQSDTTFTVVAHLPESITLVQPNGGETWAVGTSHLVSWYSNITDPVRVELYHKDTLYAVLDSSNTDNRYAWTIANSTLVDTTYRIKVFSTADTTVADSSDAKFSVVQFVPGGGITLEQPNVAGIQWVRGKEYIISWTDNLTEPVNIDLTNGTYTTQIAADVEGSTYSWTIPDTTTVGSNYKIIVTSSQQPISDTSANPFSIVAFEPGGFISVIQPSVTGIEWTPNTEHLISWKDNLAEPVDIVLLRESNSTLDTLATNVEGSTYTWAIPDTISLGSYKMIVSSSLQPISDTSNNSFTIVPYVPGGTVHVIQPNVDGIQWALNTTHLISWTDNLSEPVDITLLDSTGTGYTTSSIATNVEGSTYSWTIPNTVTVGSKYKIIVSSSAQPVSDTSDAYFSVVQYVPGGMIHVIQPDSAEQWAVGTAHIISWTDNLSEPVNIELYNGTTTTTIASNVEGSTYGWLIPETADTGSNYKIIVSSSLQAISDTSNYTFSLTAFAPGGEVTVESPNGGEQWAYNTEHLISWSRNNAYPLKVELLKADTVYTVLAASVDGNSIAWTVPDSLPVDSDYKIKVINTVDTTVYDESDNYFTIATWPSGGFVTVEAPNGGESWYRGTGHLISWQGNLTENYNIYLVHYDASDVVDNTYSLATNIPGTTFTWDISTSVPISDHYRIKISGTSQSTIADSSDAYFTVTDPPVIKAYPNPTTSYVTVQLNENKVNKYNVTVYNRFGYKVWTGLMDTENTKSLRIPTYNLPDGIYFVTLISNSNRITKSIIVQH